MIKLPNKMRPDELLLEATRGGIGGFGGGRGRASASQKRELSKTLPSLKAVTGEGVDVLEEPTEIVPLRRPRSSSLGPEVVEDTSPTVPLRRPLPNPIHPGLWPANLGSSKKTKAQSSLSEEPIDFSEDLSPVAIGRGLNNTEYMSMPGVDNRIRALEARGPVKKTAQEMYSPDYTSSYSKGGSVGRRGDGLAQRGKTKGRMV